MLPDSAILSILREAGFCRESCCAIEKALETIQPNGLTADDLADALFRWRRTFARRRLAEARERAKRSLEQCGNLQAAAVVGCNYLMAMVDEEMPTEPSIFPEEGSCPF